MTAGAPEKPVKWHGADAHMRAGRLLTVLMALGVVELESSGILTKGERDEISYLIARVKKREEENTRSVEAERPANIRE